MLTALSVLLWMGTGVFVYRTCRTCGRLYRLIHPAKPRALDKLDLTGPTNGECWQRGAKRAWGHGNPPWRTCYVRGQSLTMPPYWVDRG